MLLTGSFWYSNQRYGIPQDTRYMHVCSAVAGLLVHKPLMDCGLVSSAANLWPVLTWRFLQELRTQSVLLAHKERVTFVHWLPAFTSHETRFLVSGACDGSIALWSVLATGSHHLLHMTPPGSGHSSSVNAITSMLRPDSQSADVISVAGDSTTCCWHVDPTGAFHLLQTLTTSAMQQSAALSPIPSLSGWCAATS